MDHPEDGTVARPLGRRARKALATRHALFEAGLAAFQHRPLHVVSVLDITEASDVAKGVFYLHFRGKDEYLLELWGFVQEGFLERMRERLAEHTERDRVETAVVCFHAMVSEAPRTCRFWIRMAAYFEDEVGPPGQMGRLRDDYLRRLAALIAGVAREQVGEAELRTARVVDGACWGLISQELAAPDAERLGEEGFTSAVSGAVGALG